jgi:hypothetical protein
MEIGHIKKISLKLMSLQKGYVQDFILFFAC